jgi:hypothetical protein
MFKLKNFQGAIMRAQSALDNPIDASRAFSLQNQQYAEKLLMTDTVPVMTGDRLGRVSISTLGNFLCTSITGDYQTLATANSVAVDDGVCHLRGQLIDGNGNRKLFNDYIPFDLWLSPGRVKSAAANNTLLDYSFGGTTYALRADAGHQLFFPMPFKYLFAVNSEILLYVKNDGTQAMTYNIAFHGIRIFDKRTSR